MDNANNFFCVPHNNNNDQFKACVPKINNYFNATKADNLFDAVRQSNNESVVCALIAAGADVNRTDNKGKTALFYAVQQSNNESVVCALIAAGADVNKTDHCKKTSLFYAIQSNNEIAVHVLIDKCKANINTKDVYGRTPLFYAIAKSLDLTRYLLDKGANLHLKDNCGVSILSFFIEDCILNKYDGLLSNMADVIDFLITEHGVKRKTVFKRIVNVVFCQFLRVLVTSQMFRNAKQTKQSVQRICDVLQLAKNYAKEEKKQESKDLIDVILENMNQLLTNDGTAVVTNVPNVLELLIKLGANPTDSVDSDGNTSIHFVAQLSLLDNSQETMQEMLEKLANCEVGNLRKLENHQHETPLVHLFSLSRDPWKAIYIPDNQLPNIGAVNVMCRFLLEHGSSVEETSRTGKTVFHWILEIIQKVLLWLDTPKRNEALTSLLLLFELFSSQNGTEVTVNQKDANDGLNNTPLHLWASLQLGPGQDYASNIAGDYTFETFLKKILDSLMENGVQDSSRNKNSETPLHLCRTWCALKFLTETIKNKRKLSSSHLLNDKDSLERPPLLAAAKNKKFLQVKNRFFPDVSLEPKELFLTFTENNLNLWAVDKNGESLLSVLIKHKAFDLAEALVEVTLKKKNLSNINITSLINAICKERTSEDWEKASGLFDAILEATETSCNLPSALISCCRNICEREREKKKSDEDENDEPPPKKSKKGDDSKHNNVENSFPWKTAQKILSRGTDFTATDVNGQSPQDFVKECPLLKRLVGKPETLEWVRVSQRHKPSLEKVASGGVECVKIDKVLHHEKHLGRGSIANHKFHVGIVKNDGREVAVKRLLKTFPNGKQTETEILIRLQDCQQVIKYYSTINATNCIYHVYELMEGKLALYLEGNLKINVTMERSIDLVRQLLKGVKYIHSKDIIHCDLNPGNVLLKVDPKTKELRLKITGFELSRRSHDREHRRTSEPYIPGTKTMKQCLAPELLRRHSKLSDLTKKSDMFSCSLIVYYILSVKGHPFRTLDHSRELSEAEIEEKIIDNIRNNKKARGWADELICPAEVKHMIKKTVHCKIDRRKKAEEVLKYPIFWNNERKINFLKAVANEQEFADSRCASRIERNLQKRISIIVEHDCAWNDDRHYSQVRTIYEEMKKRRDYDVWNAADLVRLFRNACEHYKFNDHIRKEVFFEYFPSLVTEVYNVVTAHGWHQQQNRKDLKTFF